MIKDPRIIDKQTGTYITEHSLTQASLHNNIHNNHTHIHTSTKDLV